MSRESIVVAGMMFLFGLLPAPTIAATVTLNAMTSEPSSIAVGDLNGDYIDDIAIASRYAQGITTLLSSSTIGGYIQGTVPTAAVISDLQIFDRNSDGDKDIVFAPEYDFLREVTNLGGGLFSTSFQAIGRSVERTATINVADIDNDGKSEILATPSYHVPSTLVPTEKYFLAWKPDANYQYFSALDYGSFPEYMTSADISDVDSDGFVDLVVASPAASTDNSVYNIGIWFNAHGSLSGGVFIGLKSVPLISQIKLGDVTGDDKGDIVIVSASHGLVVLPYLSNRTFGSPVVVPNTAGARALSLADYNGDGRKEIFLVRQVSNSIRVNAFDYANGEFYITDEHLIQSAMLAAFSSGGLGYGSDTDVVMMDYDQDSELELLVPHKDLTANLSVLSILSLSPVYRVQNNSSPYFSLAPSTAVFEGTTFTLDVSATDPDGDTLTYSAANLPTGATYDSVTGQFTWTPDYNDAGEYVITLTSTDDGQPQLSASTTLTITVLNANRAPVLSSIGNQTVVEGQTLTFTLDAADPDGDSLSYTATNLPAGSTFDPLTHTFIWNTNFDDSGNYENIEFTVTDDGSPMELDFELITITVGDVNRAPVFENPGSQTVLETEQLDFSVTATDPDSDSVVVTATNLPSGASWNGSTFTWVPSLNDSGVYTITLTATDDGLPSGQAVIDVVITVGDNPTPTEQAEDLIEDVVVLDLPTNVENAYMANLQKVGAFIEEGKVQAALNQLQAFINKITQDYNQGILANELYTSLLNAAEQLIEDLGG